MNPIIQKNKNTLVMIAIILLSLLAAKKANDMNTVKYDQLKIDIKQEEDKTSALQRIVANNEKIKKIQDRSWDTTNFEAVVQRVSELSEAADIKISSIVPSEKKAEDNYTSIPFSFTGETTYRHLEKFLKSLEKEKKLLRLKEISLAPVSGSETDGQDVILACSFSGDALYFK